MGANYGSGGYMRAVVIELKHSICCTGLERAALWLPGEHCKTEPNLLRDRIHAGFLYCLLILISVRYW
jgi:hypothetical protein